MTNRTKLLLIAGVAGAAVFVFDWATLEAYTAGLRDCRERDHCRTPIGTRLVHRGLWGTIVPCVACDGLGRQHMPDAPVVATQPPLSWRN